MAASNPNGRSGVSSLTAKGSLSLLELIDDAVLAVDAVGVVAGVSKAAGPRLGRRNETLLARPFRETVAPSHHAALADALRQAWRDGQARCTLPVIQDDGVSMWTGVEMRVCQFTEDEEVLFVRVLPGSGRPRGEDAGSGMNEFLELPGVLAYSFDIEQGRVRYVSASASALFGFSPELDEDPFIQWAGGIHPDDRSRVIARLTNAFLASRRPCFTAETEYRRRSADGQWVWVQEALSVSLGEGRQWRSLTANAQETARERGLRQALDETQKRYYALGQWLPFYSYESRIYPDGTRRIERIADQFFEVTGLDARDFIGGVDWRGLVHPDDAAVLETRDLNLEPGESEICEYRIIGKDDRLRYVRDAARAPFPQELGEPVVVHAVVQDITEQREHEERLHRRDRVLAAVSDAASILLESRDPAGALRRVVALLGGAAGISRAYVFEIEMGEEDQFYGRLTAEWCDSGVASRAHTPLFDHWELAATGHGRWIQELSAGRAITGAASAMPAEEQPILEQFGVLTMAAMPIFVDGEWWGLFGFEHCRSNRGWSVNEMEALRSAAALVGAFFARTQAEERLRQAHTTLEQRVTERTAELARSNEDLRREVAERQRAEAALRRSEDKFAKAFHASPDCAIIARMSDDVILEVNEAFERVLGYSQEDVVGAPLSNLSPWAHPDHRRQFHSHLSQAGSCDNFETRFTAKHGRKVAVLLSARIVELANQPCVLYLARDISERKQSEERIRRLREFREAIVENANVMVGVLDHNGHMVVWNKAAERITGYLRQEVLGHARVFEWVFPDADSRASIQGIVQRALQGGIAEGLEFSLRSKEEQERTVAFYCRGFTAEEGRPASAILVGVDITQRVQTERALREQQEVFNTFMNQLPGIALIEDADHRLVFANDYLRGVFGPLAAEGARPEAYLPPEDAARALDAHAKAMRDAAFTGEEGFRDQQGAVRHWHMCRFRLERKGKAPLVGSAGLDITAHKAVEERLRASEERFARIFAASPLCLVISRMQDGAIVDVNQRFEEQFGYPRETVVGAHFGDIGLWADQRDYELFRRGVLERGQCTNFETTFRSRDGRTAPMLVSARHVDLDGEDCVLAIAHDISERKQMEEALRASEERFRTLADYTYDWEYWLAPEGDFLYVSPSCERITGYDRSAFLSHPDLLVTITHPQDRERLVEHISEIGSSPEVIRQEFRIITRDGEERWISHICQPVYGDTGAWIGRRASNRDITHQKRAEEALRESEKRFRGIIENAQTGYVTVDRNGAITYVNQAYADLLGYERREQLTGRHFIESVVEQDVEEGQSVLRRVLQGHVIAAGELRAKRCDGTLSYQTFSFSPIYERGRIVGAEGFVMDLTERLTAEERLRESEERYRAMMASMHDLVYICDDDNRIEYMNPAMVDWLGRDATGEVCHQAFYDQGERCDWCVSEREEGDAWQWEVTGPKDGRTYRITSSPVRHGDGSYSRMILMHDITEMKEAERERLDLAARSQHAQKLESLGVLAGGIAHDFNNLLMGILGNASLALMDLEGDAQPARHVEQIQDAAQRAADLTRQMLAYSGKGRFIVEPIQLNTLIQDMDPLFRAAISSRIQLEYILSPELPPIEADASQIRQLMMNLVINAAEAIGPKSGSVTITTGNTYCSAETFAGVFPHEAPPPGKYVRIAVSDTGKGMDEETIARVFDPFFTTKFMGRGLGLAAAIGIVRGHRGAVSIKSAPQHGSTFIIYLPAFAENESEEPV